MTKSKILEEFTKHRHDHKSYVFLYPLLQLPKTILKPLNTFLYLNKKEVYKYKYLFALYHESLEKIEEAMHIIEDNNFFDFKLTDRDGYIIVVFMLENHSIYFDKIMKGEYSKLEPLEKLLLNQAGHPIAAIGTNPQHFYRDYADDMDISESDIAEGANLINPPNMTTEILQVDKKVMSDFYKYTN